MQAERFLPSAEMPPRLDKKHPTEKVLFAAPSVLFDRVDEWRRAQPGRLMNRNEAIRQLVEQALDAAKKGGRK